MKIFWLAGVIILGKIPPQNAHRIFRLCIFIRGCPLRKANLIAISIGTPQILRRDTQASEYKSSLIIDVEKILID
jgi:hypothetical protein